LVSKEFKRSITIKESAIPPATPLPGLSAPSAEGISDINYAETLNLIPHLISSRASALHPGLARKRGQTFRDYLYWLCDCGCIPNESTADHAVEIYEDAKFDESEGMIEEDFRQLMELLAVMLNQMRTPPEWDWVAAVDERGALHSRPSSPVLSELSSTDSIRIIRSIEQTAGQRLSPDIRAALSSRSTDMQIDRISTRSTTDTVVHHL
jgi:hypothetical protein